LLVCSAFLFVSSPFSLSPSPPHHHLHSFPTRRSSDLRRVRHPPLHGRRLRRQLLLQQSRRLHGEPLRSLVHPPAATVRHPPGDRDRKSTRLNSSHQIISYAVFCLKKKKIH